MACSVHQSQDQITGRVTALMPCVCRRLINASMKTFLQSTTNSGTQWRRQLSLNSTYTVLRNRITVRFVCSLLCKIRLESWNLLNAPRNAPMTIIIRRTKILVWWWWWWCRSMMSSSGGSEMSSSSSRHQVYRGLSPTTSSRMEVPLSDHFSVNLS